MNDSILTTQDSILDFDFTKQELVPLLGESDDDAGDRESESSEEGLIGRISERIAAYALLYDIPFCYLLPGEEMLPPNSLRFFYLDNNWVMSLMDGALSLGRTVELDIKHDWELARNAYAMAMRDAEKIRRILQGREPLDPIQNADTEDFIPEICTGFLIRSPLVTGWRGLEFKAYNGKGAELRALRIETLAHDVLLAMFLGEIEFFTLTEPPEGLHYGIEHSETGIVAGLRSFKDGSQDGITTFAIPERGRRVIDFTKTAENIKQLTGEEKMDSAKVALQLTQTACTLEVRVNTEHQSIPITD